MKWGQKGYVWTKEKQDLLLKLIEENENIAKLELELKCCYPLILRELRNMGFEGLRDARKVMKG